MIAAAVADNPVIMKSLPLGSNPNGVRDPATLQNELLLAWTLSTSTDLNTLPSSYNWGYILPDGTVQNHALQIDSTSLQPESTTSQALEGFKGHERNTEALEGSRLFIGNPPDGLNKKDSALPDSPEGVSESSKYHWLRSLPTDTLNSPFI